MRVNFFQLPVDCLPTADVVGLLIDRLNTGNRTRIVTLNPEMLMAAREFPGLQKAINQADLVIPDGVGVVLSLRSRGYRAERIPGIDLAYLLMSILCRSGGSVFLLGGTPGVAFIAGERLKRELPGLQIVGAADGFFSTEDEKTVIDRILTVRPDLLIVGMGTPRQELWLEKYWTNLEVPVAIGVGGAIDVWAGRMQRAPAVMRRFGMEWLYRVWVQPRRWRRLLRLLGFLLVVTFNLRRKGVSKDGAYSEQD